MIFIMASGTGLIAVAPDLRVDRNRGAAAHRDRAPAAGFLLWRGARGATAILAETAPEGRRGLYASWQAASQAAGLLLGALVTMLVSLSMTPAELEAGGWRWPFWIGLVIAPVGIYLRAFRTLPALRAWIADRSDRRDHEADPEWQRQPPASSSAGVIDSETSMVTRAPSSSRPPGSPPASSRRGPAPSGASLGENRGRSAELPPQEKPCSRRAITMSSGAAIPIDA